VRSKEKGQHISNFPGGPPTSFGISSQKRRGKKKKEANDRVDSTAERKKSANVSDVVRDPGPSRKGKWMRGCFDVARGEGGWLAMTVR